MTQKERNLAANLLKLASDSFSNHGCNDLSKETIAAASFTNEEKATFVREYIEWDGDPDGPEKFEQIADWALMRFLAFKLQEG